jgi:hypothetical protein
MSDPEEPEVRQDAPPEDVVVEPEGDGEVDFHPFDEFDEEYAPRPMQAVTGEDGLPTLPDQSGPSDIPVLSKETMVCMGDYSKFVIRDRWGEIIAEFEPMEVDRSPNGWWRVPMKLAVDRAQTAMAKARKDGDPDSSADDDFLLAALSAKFVKTPYEDGGYGVQSAPHTDEWFEVEPLRPECRHYVRQLLHPGSIEGAKKGIMLRACAARRDTSGAMMQLRDSAMLACGIRSPRSPAAEIKLDEFDAEKIRQGQSREHLSMFDSVTSAGGIFEGTAEKEE